ncbi:hypothetical protein K9857_04170 [Pseudomonas sp. REP124]|uniref:hypothetical protein n=1 Tax=unclassified Pseudomonas TaxID=196821 RepID=UPI001CC91757|nr:MULTISPECIES: hypothetical protein [unclassified Pseudomonas]MBZ9780748.1 hypothetical protein [Pseudomonas sp. REP124]
MASAGQIFFAEKIQNHRQVAAADAIVINQQNFGFTPHAIATSLVNSMPKMLGQAKRLQANYA